VIQREGRPTDPDPAAPVGRGEETERIDSYLGGDTEAFEEMDRWIRIELRHRYPGLHDEHEDLCQTVHEKLLDNLRTGRFEGRSALRTYVTGIVHHTAIDRVREIRRQREGLIYLARETAIRSEGPRQRQRHGDPQLLHEVVSTLPASCRDLLRLIFIDKLGYREIGRRLEIPEGTVKSRMWHCRRKAMAALARLRRVRGKM
jgi:RNA polymerase sigma-70 factor (ECF subfamily)